MGTRRVRRGRRAVRNARPPLAAVVARRLSPRAAHALLLAAGALLGLSLGLAVRDAWPDRLGRSPLAVQRVAVLGASRVAPDELARAAGVAPGTAFADLDRAAVAARVAAHPWVLEARATALPPDHLLVEVREREPVARAWLGEPPRPWWMDAAGYAFAPAGAATELPEIRGAEPLAPGAPHPELARAAHLLAAAARRELPAVRAVRVGGDDPNAVPSLVLDGPAGPLEVVVGNGAFDAKLARLEALLRAGRADTAGADTVDVRFGGQVILRGGRSPEETDAAEGRGRAAPPGAGRAG